MTTRWGEHDNPTHDSEMAKHLKKIIHHVATGQSW